MKETAGNHMFATEAEYILSLETAHQVHSLGGYGTNGEVIYQAHPANCPSVLTDGSRHATATFMSNGSVDFTVTLGNGMEVRVLDGHYDISEKREIGLPSSNVWVHIAAEEKPHVASLMNPALQMNCSADKIKLVKEGDPDRSFWYCSWFHPMTSLKFVSAIRLSFVDTDDGPALLRSIYVRNVGRKNLDAQLFSYFQLHGTQYFAYNKEIWYDIGMPISNTETIMNATVPYSEMIQLRRLSSRTVNADPVDATCDQSSFIGKTNHSAAMPQAVINGAMLAGGAGKQLNRFATAAVGANQFRLSLPENGTAEVHQSLLYVLNQRVSDRFRRQAGGVDPSYVEIEKAFKRAGESVVRETLGVDAVLAGYPMHAAKREHPCFEIQIPKQPVISLYANSAWTAVKELYENCRGHGARMAEGIELGTRDRAQDMWPMMKEDPDRVRRDLIHAFGMMYWIVDENLDGIRDLALPQKLHGMFPRQYPSAWTNREHEVKCDNRPYADSPLWLINAVMMYVRETGDISILLETVTTVRLANPEDPVNSGIINHDRTQKLFEAVLGALHCFERLAAASPYGMAQVMYGDWCDPVDMFGTDEVGNPERRAHGAGVQARLSAHLFLTLVETMDILQSKSVKRQLAHAGITVNAERLSKFAERLRNNTLTWAFENDSDTQMPGFIGFIHEKRMDGSTPNYRAGERGYTLGSMRGTDFDGCRRRDLTAQAYGLEMVATRRAYLRDIPNSDEIIRKILHTVDNLFHHPKLGLLLFTTPIPNSENAIAHVGRMGMVPPGCAENGEYHHAQIMMHRYRLNVVGQADTAWQQFKPMISAMRNEDIAGPFETPCTSYVSDKDDPHFGKAMYFGRTGSIDWIIELFHEIAGIRLALHDEDQPALSVHPKLPKDMQGQFSLKRFIHVHEGSGYRRIPLTVKLTRKGVGETVLASQIFINGKESVAAEVMSLRGLSELTIDYIFKMG